VDRRRFAMEGIRTKGPKGVMLLSLLIGALAAAAAGIGIFWQGSGAHFEFTTLRGQVVEMQGGDGLYRYDSVSGAAQVIAGDIVTLCIGIPLLLIAALMTSRGSLRGRLLLTGTLGYFLYTYTSLAMLAAYNELFLVYVALMSLSLFAFVMSVLSIDVASLPAHFSDRFPRKRIAGFLLFLGSALALMWSGVIVTPLLSGTYPATLESYTTMVIQAMDLGLIVPAAMLSAVLLLRRAPFGYLLSSIVLVKGFTLGAAVSAMALGIMLAGVPVSPVELVLFPVITVIDIGLTVLMLRSLRDVAAVNTPRREPERGAPQMAPKTSSSAGVRP
jgi:hypothetical protein